MISAKRAMTIVFEQDADKCNKLIDKLTEEDAKYMLKHCLTAMSAGSVPKFADEKSTGN